MILCSCARDERRERCDVQAIRKSRDAIQRDARSPQFIVLSHHSTIRTDARSGDGDGII